MAEPCLRGMKHAECVRYFRRQDACRSHGQSFRMNSESSRDETRSLMWSFSHVALSAAFVAGMIALQTLTFAVASYAGIAPAEDNRFREAVNAYEIGWAGDDEALLQALDLLEALRESSAASPEVHAYWGSACIARARLAPNWRKRSWLERGAKALDAAVAAADQDIRVRLLRATSFAVLPSLAGKTEVVEADFDWLLKGARQMPQTSSVRQEIYYHAGAFALRNRDTRALIWLEEAQNAGDLGGIPIEQIARMLQLARSTLATEPRQ